MSYGNYAPFYRGGYFNPIQTPTMPQYQPMQDNGNQYMPQCQNGVQGSGKVQNGFVWVLNENEAMARYVAPGESELSWDINNPIIYIKSVNVQGVPSMRILDFTERTAETPVKTPVEHVCECKGKFVTIDAFNALQSEFDALTAKFEEMNKKPVAKTRKTEVTDNE